THINTQSHQDALHIAHANDHADALTAEAVELWETTEHDAEGLRAEAEQVKADGEAHAQALRYAALADADQILDEARKAADKRRADAAEQADALIGEATAEAERLTAEAAALRAEAEQ
ncbi:hypothetical protein PUR59_05390, partial [Streptomyces sp. SP18ES09]|uniref:hypothetical protein n=1 Tax=Streptomyces sp. SP18ES09 TaxID=3002532 RepID=UPI002E75A0F0